MLPKCGIICEPPALGYHPFSTN